MSDDLLQHLAELAENRFFGKYRGEVIAHEILPTRGRVEVKVPAVLGDLCVLAEICVPYAGDGVGLMLLPEVGSGCWVEFEGGDPSLPIWVGAFWGDGQLPDRLGGSNTRLLRTSSCELRLDDSAQTLTALSDQGGTLTLDGDGALNAGMMAGEVRLSSAKAALTKGVKGVEVSEMSVSVNGSNLEVS
jgi:hypothetical protein